jgi:hypothetical protein
MDNARLSGATHFARPPFRFSGGQLLPLEMMRNTALGKIVSKFLALLLAVILLYLIIGLGFHLKWKSALTACSEARKARGEFVEPEVLGGPLGLAFDMTFWPVYAWANMTRDGTPFATPCTH